MENKNQKAKQVIIEVLRFIIALLAVFGGASL